jgi:hypothetical protein
MFIANGIGRLAAGIHRYRSLKGCTQVSMFPRGGSSLLRTRCHQIRIPGHCGHVVDRARRVWSTAQAEWC